MEVEEARGKYLLERLSSVAERLDASSDDDGEEIESLMGEAKAVLDPSTAMGQVLLDSLGIDMPRILAKYAATPHASCREMSESILKTLSEFCDPRDMFAAYMEALHLYSHPETLASCPVILDGLSKVFIRLRRRRLEFFKESLSGLLRIARLAMDTGLQTWKIFDKLAHIVIALHEIGVREEVEQQKQRLHQTLGIFILLLLARSCDFDQSDDSSAIQSLLVQLAKLVPECGFSYSDMITGSLFEGITDFMNEDFYCEDSQILDTRQGAALAVCWGLCGAEAAEDDQEAIELLRDRLKSSRHAFVSALSNVLVLLTPPERSWKTVEMGINLLATMLELATPPAAGNPYHIQLQRVECNELLKLKDLLQAIQNVVIFSPQSQTRQQAYHVFVNIVRQVVPRVERYEVLKSLITDCKHSSMVSLLIYIVKEEVEKTISYKKAVVLEAGQSLELPFASERVLELIDYVLRPPSGGPPDLPNQIDAVLSVLNLYRFIVIKETTGKTNYTGVLYRARLEEACLKWLRPLRAVLEGFHRSLSTDDSEAATYVLLSLANLEGVLCRCLELAEDALRYQSI